MRALLAVLSARNGDLQFLDCRSLAIAASTNRWRDLAAWKQVAPVRRFEMQTIIHGNRSTVASSPEEAQVKGEIASNLSLLGLWRQL